LAIHINKPLNYSKTGFFDPKVVRDSLDEKHCSRQPDNSPWKTKSNAKLPLTKVWKSAVNLSLKSTIFFKKIEWFSKPSI
jgi:hypothetical protein